MALSASLSLRISLPHTHTHTHTDTHTDTYVRTHAQGRVSVMNYTGKCNLSEGFFLKFYCFYLRSMNVNISQNYETYLKKKKVGKAN